MKKIVKSKIEREKMYARSRRRQADLRFRMREVIQREGLVHVELLVLVLSGAWMSSKEWRVVKYESSKSVTVEEGLMMRGVDLRSLMNPW